jgi:copper(I)-binding protein
MSSLRISGSSFGFMLKPARATMQQPRIIMPRFIRVAAIMAALLVPTAVAVSFGHEVKKGDILLTELWSRATPPGAKVAAGFFTIENTGSEADRLVGITTPLGKAEVHQTAEVNGVSTMRPLEGGVSIAPGQKVTLAPGGLHVMITELKEPLKEGNMLPLTLRFQKAGEIDATLHIRPPGAPAPGDAGARGRDPAGHSGMKM